jgi:tetratricopeptide (TPR) repeat protein/tRNA A-37 threonylcarbamoyl transferase component Bud32
VVRAASDEPTVSGVPPPEPSEAPRIERYRILERLGAGGMATVWRAHDTHLDREVAVKVMRGRRRDPVAQARLLREAQAMARVSHPHVVQVFDVGVASDAVYVAMERIEGRTLTEWLAKERPSRTRIVEAFVAVGRALQAVHAEGLVHRDFKPHNAMVGDDGRVRLIDFGLAVEHDATDDASVRTSSVSGESAAPSRTGGSLTRTGTVMGTPAYMSPEQAVGSPATAASDQFSFCVALFEALHGRRPFSGDSYEARIAAVRSGAIAPASASIPRWLDAVVRRGLAFRVEDRFPDMATLVDRLERGDRRSRVLGPGVVAVAVAVALVGWMARPDAVEACADRGRLDELYGDVQRAAVRDGLVGTGLAYAEDTATRVRERLDRYAETWTSTWIGACAPDVAPARRDAIATCLENGREALAEAVAVLGEADVRILERAGTLVDALPDPSQCAAEEADAAVSIPTEHAPAIAGLRAELARARAMRDAGRVEAARDVSERVLAKARALDVPGFTAEVVMAHGGSIDASGDDRGAGALFEEAYHLASAHRRDALAGRAAIAAMDAAADQGDMEIAETWARHARAELARLGDPPQLRASHLDTYAQVQSKRADYRGAEASLREALDLLAQAYGDPDDPRLARTTDHLGSCLENLGRLDEAAAMHRRALEMFERGSGPDHPATGRALANLANATSELGRKQEAHGYYQRSYEILRAAHGDRHEDVGSALQGLGTAELALGNLDAARDALQRAYDIQVARGGEDDPHAGIPLNNLGNVEMQAGRVDAAEGHYRRAHELYQSQLGDDHPWTALALANLARVDTERGDIEAAIDKYTQALAAIHASVGESHLYAGMMINNRALLHVKLGRTDGAREDFLRAYDIFATIWGEDDPRLGETIYNLADLALQLGDRDEARRRLDALDRLWAEGAPSEEDAGNARALRARLGDAQ